MSKAKFALGAIIGTAIGAVVGLLTAPKSGKETRADLKAKAEAVRSDTEKKASELKAEAVKKADELKVKAEELKTRTENAVEGAKKGFNKK